MSVTKRGILRSSYITINLNLQDAFDYSPSFLAIWIARDWGKLPQWLGVQNLPALVDYGFGVRFWMCVFSLLWINTFFRYKIILCFRYKWMNIRIKSGFLTKHIFMLAILLCLRERLHYPCFYCYSAVSFNIVYISDHILTLCLVSVKEQSVCMNANYSSYMLISRACHLSLHYCG